MTKIFKTYKFAIRPTDEQKVKMEKHFGCCRFVYNYFLRERMDDYVENGKSDNYFGQAKKLTILKKELTWLSEVGSQSLQSSLKNLEKAYVNFFGKRAKFPRFKRKHSRNSFSIPQNVELVKDKSGDFSKVCLLKFPKFKEGVKIRVHRELPKDTKINSCTIIKESDGKYFACLLTEVNHRQMKKTHKTVGIDVGIKHLITMSNGEKIENPKFAKLYKSKLAKSQQHLSRKKKGSNSYDNQRRKVASLQSKISRCRTDNLHKISHNLVKDFDLICTETLAVKQMMSKQNDKKGLSFCLADCSFGTLLAMLKYKCEWNGKTFVQIDRFFPSSKMCHKCGHIHEGLRLRDRNWTCSSCSITHDRDVNAAKNILKQGKALIKLENKRRAKLSKSGRDRSITPVEKV